MWLRPRYPAVRYLEHMTALIYLDQSTEQETQVMYYDHDTESYSLGTYGTVVADVGGICMKHLYFMLLNMALMLSVLIAVSQEQGMFLPM